MLTEAEAARWVAESTHELADNADFANHFFRANLHLHMAGQLFVRHVERSNTTRALDDRPPGTFLNLGLTEAIEFFEALQLVPPEEFEALLDAERARSFTVGRAASEGLQRAIMRQLRDALDAEGPGLRAFIEAFQGDGIQAGDLPGGTRGYLENVFRTSTASSYNAGRYRQQVDATVVAAGGVWEYVTAQDSRVRASHRALHGKQWRIGDPDGARAYPPNSFNCRCVMVVRDAEDADDSALRRIVDVEGAVTDGFRAPPTTTVGVETPET